MTKIPFCMILCKTFKTEAVTYATEAKIENTVNLKVLENSKGNWMSIFRSKMRVWQCDCGKYQALHLPCSHVIAACSSFHYDYTTLIPDVFKNENVYAIYNEAFKVVHDKSYWPPYEGPQLFHNPNMQRLKKGRPNSTRIRTEMDEEVEERIPTPRLCGLCRQPGHIRRNCPTNPKR